MDKQEVLQSISQLAASHELSKEEVLAVFDSPELNIQHQDIQARLKLSDIMYYIGAAIVFLGICVLVYQNWDIFTSPVRIFITLGSFALAFIVASILNGYENFKKASQGFFLLAGLLGPLALSVSFKEMGIDYSTDSAQLGIYVLLAAVFASAFYFFRQTILLLFVIIFTSAAFHYVINLITGSNFSSFNQERIIEYRFFVNGLAFMLLGYYFSFTPRKALSGFLNSFGSLAFLGSAMALGGWSPNQNVFWELVYPLLVFGILFLSVHVKSKAFLIFGSLFLIGYILKLTGEYFTEGLGWPLALVLAGLAIMGVGYYAVRLNKKYFQASI